MQSKDFVPIYEEIARVIGEKETVKLYEKFRGQQITFPQRLYNTSYAEPGYLQIWNIGKLYIGKLF